jgi:Domain of unknown function (DUF4335)
MSLQRQYNLPNCRIILEGLSNDPNGIGNLDILMKAECHFTGIDQVLSGGQIFWQNLVQTVNIYAQECLSGLRHPLVTENGEDAVLLTQNPDKFTHILTWQPKQVEGSQETEAKIELELNTVQLFDLVEAIDQFFADTTTLPEIKQNLEPLSRRYRRRDEPVVQRATPPILGLVTVAIASFAFFVMPIPERKPTEPKPQNQSTETLPKPTTPIPSGGENKSNTAPK